VGGTYEGRCGYFVKKTEARIAVVLDDEAASVDKIKTRYLAPHNVAFVRASRSSDSTSSARRSVTAAVVPGSRSSSSSNSNNNNNNLRNHQSRRASTSQSPTIANESGTGSASNRYTAYWDVRVVGGKHEGKRGVFVKRTDRRAAVRLVREDQDGVQGATAADDDKVVYLLPKNVDVVARRPIGRADSSCSNNRSGSGRRDYSRHLRIERGTTRVSSTQTTAMPSRITHRNHNFRTFTTGHTSPRTVSTAYLTTFPSSVMGTSSATEPRMPPREVITVASLATAPSSSRRATSTSATHNFIAEGVGHGRLLLHEPSRTTSTSNQSADYSSSRSFLVNGTSAVDSMSSGSDSTGTGGLSGGTPSVGSLIFSLEPSLHQPQNLHQQLPEGTETPQIHSSYMLERLPVRVLAESDVLLTASRSSSDARQSSESLQQKPICAICREDYEVGDRVRTVPCFHCFHAHCIGKFGLSPPETDGSVFLFHSTLKNCVYRSFFLLFFSFYSSPLTIDPWLCNGGRTCPACRAPTDII